MTEQGTLFEIDPPRSNILIGTSGFSYKDWKGPFYPEKLPDREMLAYYAASFPAVEINSTYYALPRRENMEAMARKADGKLDFVVKAHRDMTHSRERVEEALPLFKTGLRPFQDRRVLGAVLLQFPYSFEHNARNRDYLAMLKDRLEPVPVVAEFRNRWWVTDRTFEFLRRHGIGYCCVDEPSLPGLPPPTAEATSPTGYIRFHGRNKETWWEHENARDRYDYEYTEDELEEWLPKIRGLLGLVLKLYVFFNNHPGGQAVRNAKTLHSMIQALSIET